MPELLQRHRHRIDGMLTCWDRVAVTGVFTELQHKNGVYRYFRRHEIPISNLERHFQGLTLGLKAAVESLVATNGLKIQYIAKDNFRKDERIKAIVTERGSHPGLVHVYSVIEKCTAYRVGRRNTDGGEFIYQRSARCLHYYLYYIDPEFGLCYFRIATYAPFRVQFYFNGHNWLAAKLTETGIGFELVDNVFLSVDDYDKANELAATLDPASLHQHLDGLAARCIPFMDRLRAPYRWSAWQVEVATDVVFESEEALGPIYEQLVRVSACSVKADQIADFLGHRFSPKTYPKEVATHFKTRSQGTCVKHPMGQA